MELTLNEALEKAVEAHKAGKIQEADHLYTSILKAQPNHPDANHNMGVMAAGVGKTQEALPFFKAALEANPSVGQFWLSYIDTLIKLDQIVDAKSVLDQAKIKGVQGKAFDELKKRLNSSNEVHIDPSQDQLKSLIYLYQQGQFQQTLDNAKQLLSQFPNSFVLYNLCGAANAGLGRFEAAIDSLKQALKVSPGYADTYNNMGNILKDKGDLEAAIDSFKQALHLKPEYAEAYNNLAVALKANGDIDAAIDNYKKAIQIKPDYPEAHFNLGLLLLENSLYDKAAEQFKFSYENSQCYLLKCLFLQNKKALFFEQLDYLISQDKIHPIIGSLGCRSSIKYGVERPNLFCKDPLNYVVKTDLIDQYDFEKIFAKSAKTILNEGKIPDQIQSLLTNGHQTFGNVFSLLPDLTSDMEKVIRLEVDKYQTKFKDSKEGFITSWPNDYSLNGWVVSMKNGGQLKPHMHEKGWISGSIYINVPKKSKADSGNLVVCIEGEQLTGEHNDQEKSIDVVTGSLCLFPASLLHYTIPFESPEERIVLAFDVVPKW